MCPPYLVQYGVKIMFYVFIFKDEFISYVDKIIKEISSSNYADIQKVSQDSDKRI